MEEEEEEHTHDAAHDDDDDDDDDDDFGDFATPMTTTTSARRGTFVDDDEDDSGTPTVSSRMDDDDEDFGDFTTPKTAMTPHAFDATPDTANGEVDGEGERGGLLDLMSERDCRAFGERARELLRKTWNANTDEKEYEAFQEFMQSISMSMSMSKEDMHRLFSTEAFAEFTKRAQTERDARNESDSEDAEPTIIPERVDANIEQVCTDVPISSTPPAQALVDKMDLISFDATNDSAPNQANADPFAAMTPVSPVVASANLVENEETDEDEFGEFV